MRIELNSLNHVQFCWFHCHGQSHFRPSRKCSVSNLSVLARAKRKREKSLGEVVGICWRSWPAKGDKIRTKAITYSVFYTYSLWHVTFPPFFFSYQSTATICASHRTRNLTIQSPSTSALCIHSHAAANLFHSVWICLVTTTTTGHHLNKKRRTS